jgi:hypothetical protein
MPMTTEVFQFLQEVYGIEDVILPVAMKAPEALEPEILFVSQLTSQQYEADYRILFEKIVEAMGVSKSRIALSLVDKPVDVSSGTKVCVHLAEQEPGWRDSINDIRQLSVYSLEAMTTHPELKKITWKYLKELIEWTSVEV